MDKIIEDICNYYKVKPMNIAKKKYGTLPEFTYKEVLEKLLGTNSITIAFPEMGRSTITRLLKKIFPGKTNSAQEWPTFLLGLVLKKKCSTCNKIHDYDHFYIMKSGEMSCKLYESNRHKETYKLDPSKINIRNNSYYHNNKDKVKKQYKEYYGLHQAQRKEYSLRRYLRLRRATPLWANMLVMNNIYANRKDGEHIDHIIPLQNPLVCGLHNEFNLRNIPAFDNLCKGNKFDPDTYVHEIP